MDERLNVLVTSAGSSTALAVIRALLSEGIKAVGTDSAPFTEIAASAFCPVLRVPSVESYSYVDTLLDLAVEYDAIMPIFDEEIRKVSLATPQFRKAGCVVLAQEPGFVALANDKLRFGEFAHQAGIGPRTWEFGNTPPPASAFPLFAKKRHGTSSRGAGPVRTPSELDLLRGEYVLQPLLSGPEYTTDVVMDGDSIALVVVKLKEEARAGLSYRARTVAAPHIADHAVHVARLMGATTGSVNVQVIDTADGPLCIEVNPRVSSSLPLTVASGANVPAWWARRALGLPVGQLSSRVGVLMRRYWEASFVTVAP